MEASQLCLEHRADLAELMSKLQQMCTFAAAAGVQVAEAADNGMEETAEEDEEYL